MPGRADGTFCIMTEEGQSKPQAWVLLEDYQLLFTSRKEAMDADEKHHVTTGESRRVIAEVHKMIWVVDGEQNPQDSNILAKLKEE